ncbi:Six-hairpin glycosidase-like protein [Rhypophila decipiens]|uniref:Glucoamylase n=1 Tax=Rhypophila decipiens TaxID=261697 RepID=A0AAN7BAK7_9PEZI|nr:Six-hairpin glycosidase-like protein [Rhypophila decipiens]
MAQVVLNAFTTTTSILQPSTVPVSVSVLNSTGLLQPAMHALSSLLLLGAYSVQAVFGRPDVSARREADILKRDVDDFITTERPYALKRVLCNIGPNGCAAAGAAAGVVVASPSKSNPDYWYTWTRDAALVFKLVVDTFVDKYDADLQTNIQNFVISQSKLQGVSNPSGSFQSGAGLGEPKFMVDLKQYTGEWGRPQRDGPPLRAIALITYAKWLVNNGYASTAKDLVWPVIKNDLAYTAQYWNQTGFDLWEEVQGQSFFTVIESHRALVEGAQLAINLGTTCTACNAVAPQILCFLQNFWDPNGNFAIANHFINYRNGRDVATILGSIHTFDPAAGCDAKTFQPCSDKALANHKAVTDSFRSIYGINRGKGAGQAVAIGRYSEDVYYNGNPWYLATLAAAEQLYDAIIVWKRQGSITVTSLSLPFFRDLVSSVSTGTYSSSSSTYTSIIEAVSAYADGYVSIVAQYAESDGSMPEQFERNSGTPIAASHLTWSYAAFRSATDRRAGKVPYSWGAASVSVANTCQAYAVAGTYSLATVTSFPAKQTPGTPTAPVPTPAPTGCPAEVLVTFNVRASTAWGQNVKLVGSIPALGNWNAGNAILLSASAYTSSNPTWSMTVAIPRGTSFSYKFIKVNSDNSVTWEADPNRSWTVPSSCSTTTASLSDSFR